VPCLFSGEGGVAGVEGVVEVSGEGCGEGDEEGEEWYEGSGEHFDVGSRW